MNVNDAELSIGIEDNASAGMQKILENVRRLGNTMGSESKQIDRAAANISKSLVQMTQVGGAASGTPTKTAASALIAQINREKAEMQRLAAAANIKATPSGGFQNATTGRFVNPASAGLDIEAYKQAAAAVDQYEARLKSLAQTQKNSTSAYFNKTSFVKSQAEMFSVPSEVFNRAARDRDKLQGIYEQMWGGGWRRQFKDMWPPEMLKGPAQFVDAMEKMPNSTRYAMYDIANSATIAGGALVAGSVAVVGFAAQYQRAFADVKRTVQGTDEVIAGVYDNLFAMSQRLPVSFSELSQIASVGGQMGISAQGIANYTDTIAKLTATTNLTADAASMALGRFKAFFAEANDPNLAVTDATFSNLASSILKVGVNSVATESGIVNVATQISSMGSYSGMTADQVIGLSGALSSIGVPPELSRGVITRLFSMIGEAVDTGGARLGEFANIAGVSADEFASSWQTERFAGIFTQFIGGIQKVQEETGGAVGMLHELGITSVRDVPVLLRLANAAGEAGTAGSLLAQTFSDARIGWTQNAELALQYSLISSTLVERIKVLGNNFAGLFAVLGEGSVGPASLLVDTLINIVQGLTAMAQNPVNQWIGYTVVGLGLLAGAFMLAVGGATRFIAFSQAAVSTMTQLTGSTAVATAAVNVLRFALLGLGIFGVLSLVIGGLVGVTNASAAATGQIQNTEGALAALRADTDKEGGPIFRRLTREAGDAKEEISDTQKQARLMGDAMVSAGDNMDGAADSARVLGDEITRNGFIMGQNTADFIKNTVLQSQALKDLADSTKFMNVTEGLSEVTSSIGYDFDELNRKIISGGTDAGEKYLESLTGIKSLDVFDKGTLDNGEKYNDLQIKTGRAQKELVKIINDQVEGTAMLGQIQLTAGDKVRKYGEDTQYATEVTEEFAVANEETMKKMAEGMGKFVDTSQLIKFTQDLNAANALTGKDAEEAADKAAKAWEDYYGGVGFSLKEYLATFEGASEIQQQQVQNLQSLMARGVPADIITDLAAMGPKATELVNAMVNGTDEELKRYVELYGKTGFNAMVAMAAQQLAASNIVQNAAKTLTSKQLQQVASDLQAGTPLVDALAKWNLDAEGKALTVDAKTKMDERAERMKLQNQLGNGISIPVKPFLTQTQLRVNLMAYSASGTFSGPNRENRGNFWTGGYTGRGGKYDYAGDAHRGEYIFPKTDVNQSTGRPKDAALLRMLNGGRAARPNMSSFAGGGYASRGIGGSGVMELGPATIQALARAIDPRVFLDGRDLSRASHQADAASQWRGEG